MQTGALAGHVHGSECFAYGSAAVDPVLDSEFFDDMLVYRTEPGLRATHLARHPGSQQVLRAHCSLRVSLMRSQ